MARTKTSAIEANAAAKAAAKKEAKGDGAGRSGNSCVIKNLAADWDSNREIRDRILDGNPILAPGTIPKYESIPNCVKNIALLEPVLQRMCTASSRALPSIDDLRDEVATLLAMCKRHGEDLVVVVEETAQTVKKLCGFVKTKARRKEVSTAPRPKKMQMFFIDIFPQWSGVDLGSWFSFLIILYISYSFKGAIPFLW